MNTVLFRSNEDACKIERELNTVHFRSTGKVSGGEREILCGMVRQALEEASRLREKALKFAADIQIHAKLESLRYVFPNVLIRMLERAASATMWAWELREVHDDIEKSPKIQETEEWKWATHNCEISNYARVRDATTKKLINIYHEGESCEYGPEQDSDGWKWHLQSVDGSQIERNLKDEYVKLFY